MPRREIRARRPQMRQSARDKAKRAVASQRECCKRDDDKYCDAQEEDNQCVGLTSIDRSCQGSPRKHDVTRPVSTSLHEDKTRQDPTSPGEHRGDRPAQPYEQRPTQLNATPPKALATGLSRNNLQSRYAPDPATTNVTVTWVV